MAAVRDARSLLQKAVLLRKLEVTLESSSLSMCRTAFLFWGGMDAFYLCLYVLRSMARGAIPFWTDFNDGLHNMHNWGGGLEFIVWLGLALQLSLIVTCVLFLLRCRVAVYLAMVQIPFRIFFFVPSISTMLVWPMLVSNMGHSVWLGLMLLSEGGKSWCLWWLWRCDGQSPHG